MKQFTKMDSSLKNKILINDERIHKLFDKNKEIDNKTQDNLENKENKSYIENRKKGRKNEISFLTEIISSQEDSSNSFISKNNNKSNIINQIKKKNNTIINQKRYNKNNNRVYNPLKSLDNSESEILNLYNYTITLNNNFKNITSKKEKQINKNKKNNQTYIIPQGSKYIYNNGKKQNNNDYISHTIDINNMNLLNSSTKSSVKINNMLERFDENQRKKKEKIELLKKQKEDEEKRYNTYIPKICKKTKRMSKHIKDDFLTRQKKFNEIKNNKKKKLKENLLKNEQEKINKNNFLLQKKSREYASVGNLNASFISEISCCTHSMVEIDQSISKLLEWENKRKEKIIKKQKEKNNEFEKIKHVPQIDKRSKSIAKRENKNKKENIFDRLAKEDDIVKEKRKILEELYTPSFKPNLNLTYRKIDEDEIIEERNNKKKRNTFCDYSKRSNNISKRNSGNNIDISRRITVNRNNNIKPKEAKTCDEIVEKNEKYEDENVFNIFRKMIINNMNKRVKNKSMENLK